MSAGPLGEKEREYPGEYMTPDLFVLNPEGKWFTMPGMGVQVMSAQLGFRRERQKTEPLGSPAFSPLAPDSGRGPQQGKRRV